MNRILNSEFTVCAMLVACLLVIGFGVNAIRDYLPQTITAVE